MDLKKELQRFCKLSGPSAFEAPVVKAAVELMAPLTDEAYVDKFGNAIGVRRCGKKNAKKLLFDAHIDEIGMIVSGYDDDGFLLFTSIGGVDRRMLPGREVTILTDPPMFGIVACLPPHVLSREEMDRSIPMKDLRIDAGLTSKEKAEKLIPVGTPVSFRNGDYGGFYMDNNLFCGKSMDDRACFLILVRTLELLKGRELDCDLYIIGSCREEVALGARTAAFAIAPDACVAVDVTHAATADNKGEDSVLGGGPEIGIGPNCTRWMTERMKAICEARRIPMQLSVMPGASGTNGWVFQIAREGIATQVLSLPERYMHTPVEIVSLKDMEYTAELLAEFALEPGWGVSKC
ncbi:MAG TPA: M42 family peptidase [Bacillota bacterium]|nr:M42 family peptidase [Bacillota bacterium]HQC35512.1 M42 family peptidase [Bacillota bacterium]